jgi:hypothetical protein
MNATRLLLAALSVMLLTTAANAQWITFTDETSTRLILEPFVDDPNGDPMNDEEEKDIGVGDLNKDGRVDAIVVRKRIFSNPGARQDVLLLQNGSGKLVDRTEQFAPGFLTTLTDARDVLIRDFNGDGWLDVVICNTFGEQPRIYMNLKQKRPANPKTGPIRLAWAGLADETASRFPTIQVPQDVSKLQFCAAWAGDIDGDGSLDIYFSNYDGSATKDVLLINDGDGNFTNETTKRLGNLANVAFGTSCEIHDVDNDGDNDIVKTSTLYSVSPFNGLDVFILFNDGSGNFFDFQSMGAGDPYMFTMGDLDNNGWLDMYIVKDGQDRVALATGVNGNGDVNYNEYTLTNQESPRTSGFGGNIHFRDIDGDGDLDLGVSPIDVDIANCDGNSGFCLLRNDGSGGLTDPYAGTTQNFNLSAHDYEYIDVNGDGRLDLILCLCEGWRVLIQDPPDK